MRNLFKNHSIYILVICLVQIIISVIATVSLVYSETITFSDSSIFSDVEKLLTTVYSQSWWALILFSLSFASLLTLAAIIYKKLEYEFLSIGCVVIMILPTINITSDIKDIIITAMLFIPIIIIKIIGYKTEKTKIEMNEIKNKKKASKK
jgi:hypothetical protein